jgi:hypothetical protein
MSTYLRYFSAALLLGILGLFASAPARAQEWSYGGYYDHDGYYDHYYDGGRDWHHRWSGYEPYWESPEENVILSARYDRLLETHPGFRHYRMWKECGPIDFSAALKDDCLSSFEAYEPEGW